MKNFEYLLKLVEEEFKELQIEELTRMMNEGQDFNFYKVSSHVISSQRML